LASFERQPAAILFPTGFAANSGTISALVGAGDAVFCDRFNHASLVDGCRTSGARLRVYRRPDWELLERELKKTRESGKRLIVTDGVFSMDGDLAPLPELCDLAERYDAMLLVDEAHGTGVFGPGGRGAAELQGVEHRVTVRVGTLSKALGSLGGFVAGSQELVDWLWNNARTQIYSTALPPAACAAAAAAIDIIVAEPERRARLRELSMRFREQLAAAEIPTIAGSTGPIVPVVLGSPERAMQVAGQLEERGFLVGASMFTLSPFISLNYDYGTQMLLEMERWDGQVKHYTAISNGSAHYHLFGAHPEVIEQLKGQVTEACLSSLLNQVIQDSTFFLAGSTQPQDHPIRTVSVAVRHPSSRAIPVSRSLADRSPR
jgi:7-keto-8-aminopelargonate synthetase-like enzyme